MSELLKLENQLCHRFYTLSNAFTRAYRPLLKALDITYPQYVTLMALWEDDDITIAELPNSLGVESLRASLPSLDFAVPSRPPVAVALPV